MRVTVVLLGEFAGPAAGKDAQVIRAKSRAEGWRHAEGDVVAFFDTRYEPGTEWLAAAGKADIVGGQVLPGEGYDWAGWVYYVIEYGWKGKLAEGNIAYRRNNAGDIDAFAEGEYDARMDVRLIRPPSFSAYLRERYAASRTWGARHVRPSRAILRVALPLMVLARTPWWRRPLTLPGVVLISLVMAWGEMVGALDGKVDSG